MSTGASVELPTVHLIVKVASETTLTAAVPVIDGEPGLVIYKVDGNGKLDGLWAIRAHDGNGTEVLTPRD